MKKIVKKYRTYKIEGTTAFAAGKTFHYPSNSTIDFLCRQGVKEIVWTNGAFISL